MMATLAVPRVPRMLWYVRTMIAMRPCSFTVDHTHYVNTNGGRQGDQATYGPYQGGLFAPGTSPRLLSGVPAPTTAGEAINEFGWTLIAPPEALLAYGAEDLDYVDVAGVGRFRVTIVRPLGRPDKPDGWQVGLERLF